MKSVLGIFSLSFLLLFAGAKGYEAYYWNLVLQRVRKLSVNFESHFATLGD